MPGTGRANTRNKTTKDRLELAIMPAAPSENSKKPINSLDLQRFVTKVNRLSCDHRYALKSDRDKVDRVLAA